MKKNKMIFGMPTLGIAAFIFFASTIFSSCQKELGNQNDNLQKPIPSITLKVKTNPFSLKNIQKAREVIAENERKSNLSTSNGGTTLSGVLNPRVDGAGATGADETFAYFKFDPSQITTQQMQVMEADTSMMLMQIPFGNGALYNDNLSLNEQMAEQLKDGYVYGVAKTTDPIVGTILSAPNLQAQQLDVLVKPYQEPSETGDPIDPTCDCTTGPIRPPVKLNLEAIRQAYLTDNDPNSAKAQEIAAADYPALTNLFGICLLKRPHGHVNYQDNEITGITGHMEPVRGMQVWALAFGIPVTTYTDNNGYYEVPWRFSLGTIMGTKAKNNRVNVKPLDTHLNGFLNNVLPVVLDFIVGSVHIDGWVGACSLKNDHDFNFTGHTQVRYWSQILNAYYFHDVYCGTELILNAPQGMVCYAQWANRDDIRSASTPMLNQMTWGGQSTNAIINDVLGFVPIGILQNVIYGVLPDMSFGVSGNTEPVRYSSRVAQMAFHELGHASMYRRVGAGWYLGLVIAETSNGGYGNVGDNNWGKVQIAEAWAEFIGTFHANNRYGLTGGKFSRELGFVNFTAALEREDWYSESWIPDGLFFDLIDVVNTNPISEAGWDNIGGATISQMYYTINSNTDDLCHWWYDFQVSYPAFSNFASGTLFNHYWACP